MSTPAAASATSAGSSSDKKTITVGIRKMRFKHKFFLIIISLVLMVFLRTGFVFFVIGMLPAIVAYYMDVSKYQYTFKSIFSANLSGILPFVGMMIEKGASSMVQQEIMGSAATWMIVYGAALVGWLMVKVCPMLAKSLVRGFHQTQIMRYEWMQKKLEAEWGPEVAQFSGDNRYKQE
jgi:hypothetical protein